MEEKHRLTDEINLAISLKLLATAYEEIAVIKMQLARDSVFNTRDFLTALSEIFFNVKSSYKNRLISIKEQNKSKTIHFRTHQTNGRDVVVFLSANNKLFGDIIPRIFEAFKQKVASSNADIAIVGKLGKELFEDSGIQKKYGYFEIPDIESTIEDLKPLLSYILQYENVTVFHGKFTNIINQEVVSSNVTGDKPLESTEKNTKEFGFIFEPSIEEILNFFEGQIFSSLFKQSVHESELAKYGSRIKIMEEAIDYISHRLNRLTQLDRRLKTQTTNKKQLERIASIALWN